MKGKILAGTAAPGECCILSYFFVVQLVQDVEIMDQMIADYYKQLYQ